MQVQIPICLGMYKCTCFHVESRIFSQEFSSISFYLVSFYTGSLTERGTHALTTLSNKHRMLLTPSLQYWNCIHLSLSSGFIYSMVLKFESIPHTFLTRTLLTEPSPQSNEFFFLDTHIYVEPNKQVLGPEYQLFRSRDLPLKLRPGIKFDCHIIHGVMRKNDS